MRIIIGLGNPGKKFEKTRHNVGFMVVDRIAEIKSRRMSRILGKKPGKLSNWKLRKKFNAEILKIIYIDSRLRGNDKEILLVKPQTFMNSSGLAVKKIPQSLNISISQYLHDLVVVHDDLDIPLGEYKIQFGKRAAGHKGVESIIQHLKTKDFWRVRIGIENRDKVIKGQSDKGEDYVLGKFSNEEKKVINGVIGEAVNKFLISNF